MKALIQKKAILYTLISFFTLSTLLFSACDSGNSTTITKITGGKGCTKIGIFLPDTTSSNRYNTKDEPLLSNALKTIIPNVRINYAFAQSGPADQLKEAEDGINQGDCILIVGAEDSVAAATIVQEAKTHNIPVIAYDRLIQSKDTSYYVSFDGIQVGQEQGQYILQHYQQYAINGKVNISLISGSQTDTNALLFSQGLHEVIDPYFTYGTLKYINETFTPDWNPASAQNEAELELTQQKDNIQVFYVANDGMADSVIKALKAAGMDKKVLVTGQDATIDGIRHILLGEQNMTVYKPIQQEVDSVRDLVATIYDGTNAVSITNGNTIQTADGGNVPAIFDEPFSVDITNISSTVLADGFVTKSQICQGLPRGTGGIC